MPNNQQEFIPVYLFLGFLEAGKTKFMQDALEDAQFLDDLIFRSTGRHVNKIGGIGPVIGSHSGPGTVALFYISDDER